MRSWVSCQLSDEESEGALDDPEPLETQSLAHPTMSVRLRTSGRILIKFFMLNWTRPLLGTFNGKSNPTKKNL